MKDKSLILLERVEKFNSFKINEEDFDPTLNKKKDDEESSMDNQEDGEEPIDDNPEQSEEPTDDQSDNDSQLEQIEMKLIDSLSEIGLVSCEAESEDNTLLIDLGFENSETFSIQMFVEDGMPKAVLMKGGQEEPVTEMELPSSFVDEDGNLVIDVDSIPVDSIKNSLSDILGIVANEEPVQEFYRFKDGMVESFSKPIKLEKKISMRYKKESKKKKRK